LHLLDDILSAIQPGQSNAAFVKSNSIRGMSEWIISLRTIKNVGGYQSGDCHSQHQKTSVHEIKTFGLQMVTVTTMVMTTFMVEVDTHIVRVLPCTGQPRRWKGKITSREVITEVDTLLMDTGQDANIPRELAISPTNSLSPNLQDTRSRAWRWSDMSTIPRSH
jgi:hypothetical protein